MPDRPALEVITEQTKPRIDPEEAFRLYVAGGARSLRGVAHTLGIPEGTVQAWSARYKWSARLRDLDSETLQGIAQSVVVATASMSLRALQTLGDVMADEGAKPADRVQASRTILDQYSRIAHLVPQLLPPPAEDDADIIELAQTPDGVASLLRQHRDAAGRR